MKRIIKDHKILSCVLGICLVGIIGVGTGFGIHQAKVANTQKALLLAQDGYIDAEELNQLGEDIVLGEEIQAPDGSTVVITKDSNGNYVTTTVKDSSGNSTGAVVPEPTPTSGGGGGGIIPTPTPAHQHTFIPHFATRQVPQTQEVYHPAIVHTESYDACNVCGRRLNPGEGACHCNGHANGCHGMYETVVDQAAWTEYVTTNIAEQYIDYYYCSECGEHQ